MIQYIVEAVRSVILGAHCPTSSAIKLVRWYKASNTGSHANKSEFFLDPGG